MLSRLRTLRQPLAILGSITAIISISVSLPALSNDMPAKEFGAFSPDDGTYSVKMVTSFEDCVALCEADKHLCTGSIAYQANIEEDIFECRLNNGKGKNTAFPRPTIEPLDYDRALAEFNAYRASHGLKALTYDDRLNRASEVHAKDLASAGILSHTGTDGSSHGDRIQLQGYYFSVAAENAAAGQPSWDSVFQGWKNSKGHNENMLRNDVSEFGLAIAIAPNPDIRPATYWVMVLAEPIDLEDIPLSNSSK